MKTQYLVIFLVILLFVSCNQKNKYELDDLANPLLYEWFNCFKSADSSFLSKKFSVAYFVEESETSEDDSKKWYDYEPYFEKWFIFSPDSSFYLDLDFYTGLESLSEEGVWMGGDIDTKVILVDVRNKKAINIIATNSSNGADDAFWVNDSIFVMLCQDFDYQNEEWRPYLSVWNKTRVIAYYSYEGKINNFRDEKFSPFSKRLQRLGIKME